jgi:hypothetical protein
MLLMDHKNKGWMITAQATGGNQTTALLIGGLLFRLEGSEREPGRGKI